MAGCAPRPAKMETDNFKGEFSLVKQRHGGCSWHFMTFLAFLQNFQGFMRTSYFSCLQGFAQTEKHVCVQRECGHRWPKQQVRCRDLADFTSKQSSEVWWNMVKLKIVQMARCSDEQHGTASSSSSQLLMRCLKCHLLSFQHTGSWSSSSGSSEGSPSSP